MLRLPRIGRGAEWIHMLLTLRADADDVNKEHYDCLLDPCSYGRVCSLFADVLAVMSTIIRTLLLMYVSSTRQGQTEAMWVVGDIYIPKQCLHHGFWRSIYKGEVGNGCWAFGGHAKSYKTQSSKTKMCWPSSFEVCHFIFC